MDLDKDLLLDVPEDTEVVLQEVFMHIANTPDMDGLDMEFLCDDGKTRLLRIQVLDEDDEVS